MKFQDNMPIYQQIEKYLYRQIALGYFKPGDKIPSVRQLAVDLTVNINTVQHALMRLNERKILYVKRGQGNFVTEDTELLAQTRKELIDDQIKQFTSNMLALRLSPQQTLEALRKYYEEKNEKGGD